mgnify:CR=1 FL=1|tara:strand:- start:189 stop:644 length:456 start_codon:yes stop_codon:yes gene_type:complete
MKKLIFIMFLLPGLLFSQNRKNKANNQNITVEQKAIQYEYAILRAVPLSVIDKKDEVVKPQKKNKKSVSVESNTKNDIKRYLKESQKSQWFITFDFGNKSTKESKMSLNEEFYSVVDALNFLGSRGFELAFTETKLISGGEVLIFYMRKPR